MLSQTIDRKDKILNKLYKRRVELDFSRRGGLRASNGTLVNGSSGSSSSSSGSGRSIAASLTCCKYCGTVYLENYVTYLPCTEATPTITFRGSMVRRHSSIIRWSLTSYLKTLHSGGMNWEAIYWHVWAACTVMKPVVSYSEMVCDNGNIIERGERGVRGDFDNSGRNSRVYSSIDSIRKSDSGSNSNSDINIRNKSEHNLRGNINSCGRDLDFMISGLDVDRYSFQDDGLLIYDRWGVCSF